MPLRHTFMDMTTGHASDAPGWLTAKQAAFRIGISFRTLNRYQADGRISPVFIPGGYRRFRPEDVDALLTTEATA